MAYKSMNLSCLAYANGFSLWHYRTSDSTADVQGAGYFDDASRMLKAGEFIMVNAAIEGEQQSFMAVVTSDRRGHVSVLALTPALPPPSSSEEPA